MIDIIKKLLILSSIIFVSCNNMVEGVNKSDTQKINTVKYGTLVAAEPVKIKGEDDGLGAITGGLLGAVIGCGEGIFDDECRDTVAVVGAIGGAILGNAVASRLGARPCWLIQRRAPTPIAATLRPSSQTPVSPSIRSPWRSRPASTSITTCSSWRR